MPHLSLAPGDATILRELLESALLDLTREISHTDTREFRRALVERREALERVLRETRQHEYDDEAVTT
jgi:hypothetical protein